MVGRRTGAAAAVFGLLGALAVIVPAAPARADGCGDDAAKPGQMVTDIPWQQKMLDPDRIWPFATGAGQTVAVIDSGVDGTHAQLAGGHVQAGWDLVTNKADSNVDCISHGTAVAALIAAQRSDQVGFHGLAPGTSILPIRVGDTDPGEDPDGPKQPPASRIAAAVTWAAGHGATVIDVSASMTADDAGLHNAVQKALDANIVVVAAAGDQRNSQYAQDPPVYPAAYPGVIGVGSIDESFNRGEKSQIGPYVSIMAPGDSVLSATRIAGYQQWTGTSLAAGIVAGTAAMVRQAHPDLSQQQVVQRILATADPAPGGQKGPAYGHGIVNPYRAVSEKVSGGSQAKIPGIARPTVNRAAVAREHWWHWTDTIAVIIAGGIGFLLILVLAAAFVLPRGRRVRWRPGRAPPPSTAPEVELDEVDDKIFAVPKPHGEE